MKSRIRKFALYAALATPVSYCTGHALRSVSMIDVTEMVKFYEDIPSRFNEAVTNFKMLPERMNPTCSECN